MRTKIFAFLMLLNTASFATHMIGGYIAMEHVTGYSYNVKYVSLTNVGAQIQADRCTQIIYFSDGDSIIVPRVNGPLGAGVCDTMMGEIIANGLKYSVYKGIKTFATQGNFKAWVYDANRNDGIINIPGSVNVPFYCETFLRVFDPALYCPVSTVDFGNFPLFKAAINNSFDSDLPLVYSEGDSITYRIDTCKTSFGNNIVGYSIPQGVAINSGKGKFTINSPQVQGQFSFALRTNKWRNSVLVSYTILDFGVNISSSFANIVQLPINSNLVLNNDNIYAGNFSTNDTIEIAYINSSQYQLNLYSEIQNSFITQTNNGAITNLSIANLSQLERKQPYKLTIRATDSPMTTNASKDYIFYFTVGVNDSTQCTLPQDLGKNEMMNDQFQIFPNPAQEYFTLVNKAGSQMTVYDLMGKVVLSKYIINDSENINIEHLPKGIYAVSIGTFASKLIKN